MNRRTFLTTTAVVAPLAGQLAFRSSRACAAAAPTTDWRRFEITTRVSLPDAPGPAQLWLPLAQTAAGYQDALSLRWQGGGQVVESVRDARYGAPMLRSTWEAADHGDGGARQLEVFQTVATRERTVTPLAPLTEAERRFWTEPPPGVPTAAGPVRETAARITAGQTEPRARLRALYDWVIDHTYRDSGTPGCGTGDFGTMLSTGRLGGKCVDINGLMVGLARAAGFPAREVYGLRVADSRLFPSLGRSGDVSKAQHCRCEVFLEDEGWFPLDPADVRKVVLEEKLALASPEVRALRDRLFGAWEMNWVGYNSATSVELPGAAADQKPSFAFLMYPCAFTSAGQVDCLNPAQFRYAITTREVV